MFDEPTREAHHGEHARLRQRASPAAASRSTRRSARSARCSATCCRWRATCRPGHDGPEPASSRRSAPAAPQRRAGGRGAGRAVRAASTPPSAPSPRSPARTSRTTITEGPPRWTRRSSPSRCSGRSCRTPTALFRDLRPGVRALRDAAPVLADALRSARPAAAHPRAQPAARDAARHELQDFAEDPLVPRGIDDLDDTAQSLNPTLALPQAGPDAVQLRRRSGSATSPACSPRATPTAPGSASSSSPRRRARTTRAARRPRPPTARRPTTTCTPTRTRTPRRPASRRSARPATRPTSRGKTLIGNTPGPAAGDHGRRSRDARPQAEQLPLASA